VQRAVVTWAGNAIALYVAVAAVGDATLAGWTSLLVAAAVFGIVNALVKPVVKLFALPLIIITVGIALFFVNVLMLWITDAIVGGIHFDGFVALVTGSIVIWVVNMLLTWLPGPLSRLRSSIRLSLDESDVLRLGALCALGAFELDLRTLGERLEAVAGDCAVVDEQVLTACVRGDEAIPLRIVEPLDGSGCHFM
jgi:putative membrane protein